MNNLGVLSVTGRGKELDRSSAYMWYSLAAANGDAQGENNRKILLQHISAPEIEKGHRLSLEWLKKHPAR